MDLHSELMRAKRILSVVTTSLMDAVAGPDIDVEALDGSIDVLVMLLNSLEAEVC